VRSVIEGIKRYEKLHRPRYTERFATLASGQHPQAMFIGCADSRLVPNLLASAEPGELFVVRNVANLVPPNEGDRTAEPSVAAAVEYAVEVLRIADIIVCGHSGCGGARALLEPPPSLEAVRRWLAPASASVELWRTRGPLDPSYAEHDQLSQVTTLHQLENLLTYPCVRDRVERGELRLHACWFDIPAGRLLAYSETAGRFIPAVDALEPPEPSRPVHGGGRRVGVEAPQVDAR